MTFMEIKNNYEAVIIAAEIGYRQEIEKLFAGKSPVDIVVEIIKSYDLGYYRQVFSTNSWCDKTETIYSGKRVDGRWWYVNINEGYGYFDVTGLTDDQYADLKAKLGTDITCEW